MNSVQPSRSADYSRQALLSIIVPVLNEAGLIRSFLKHLRELAPDAEIIVVDGGSADGTPRLCRGLAHKIMRTHRGRARQMNVGAEASAGDILWFLHADSRVTRGAIEQMKRTLENPRIAGGCFRLRFPRRALLYRVSDSLGNLGVDLFRISLGDHGFFCHRAAFARTGGYPEVPLMEDAEFYRALRREGQTHQLTCEIQTSPRRYEELGPYRTTAIYTLILALYIARVPLSLLAKIHRRFVLRGRSVASAVLDTVLYERSVQT